MKKTLAAALAALLAAAAVCGCGRKTPPAAPATLAVASDLHYVGRAIEDGGELFTRVVEEGDGRQLDYIRPITDAFLAEVAQEGPDALILTGDLTFNGEKASHEELAAKLNKVVEAGVPAEAYINPVPGGLVLTGIVVAVSTTALFLALTHRLYRRYHSLNLDVILMLARERTEHEAEHGAP